MEKLGKIAFFAFLIALCGQNVMVAMKGRGAKDIAELRAKAARARAEAARLEAEAVEAELAAAEAEEDEPAAAAKAPAAEEKKAEEDEDSSAEDLATDTPKDLDAALVAFAQELKKFDGKEAQLEEKIGACFERHHFGHRHGHHGGHGKWGFGPHGGRGGSERYNLTLTEFIAELKKEGDLAENKLLKRELIRWVWHVLRSENRLGKSEEALVTAAKAVLDKTPRGRGHHRIHDWGRPGMAPGRGERRMGPPLEDREAREQGKGPGRGPGHGRHGYHGGHGRR